MALKEYLMTTNNFDRPTILKGNDAIYNLLVKLALLEPGTIQTHPEAGLGLLSNYRYSFDAEKIRMDYKKQIETYLPSLRNVEVLTEINTHYLLIQINVDGIMYPINVDMDTNKLSDITN